MAATTLKAIIDRFQAVLEASPLSLTATREPFSHDRQPATLIDSSYRIEDGGLIHTQSITNSTAARIDRLTVWIAQKMKFAGQTQVETIETSFNTIERYLKADGPSNSYHVELDGGRRITRALNSDVAIGSISFLVDYDFNEATS